MAARGNGTTRLSQMLHLWRTVNRLSLRDVAKESKISHATLMRIEHGYAMDTATFFRLCAWLFAVIGPAPRSREGR